MTEYTKVPDTTYTVNNDGHHECPRCGSVWFATVIVIGADGHTVASGVTGAECSECGRGLDTPELCLVPEADCD